MYLRRGAAYVLLGLSSYVAAVDTAPGFKGEILYPKNVTLTVYQNDVIIVRYNSEIPDNTLYTWCGEYGGKARCQARIQDAAPYNGEELITINYTTSDTCWFNLKSNENPTDWGYNSAWFKVASGKRATASTFSLGASTTSSLTSSSSPTSSSSLDVTSSPSTTTSTSETGSSGSPGDVLGTETRIGLGVGITVGVIGITALAVAFWMVRRRNKVVKRAETNLGSEELQGDMPKRPWWHTDFREMASNEELRQGPQHELPG